jgi:hypothetical protein
MSALLAFVAGLLTALALWRAMAPQFHESDVLRRQNYRGHELPVASGVIVVLAVVAVSAAYSVFIRFGADAAVEQVRLANLLAYSGTALGYGLLGLLDDLVGATATKGFRGHLGALAHGRVTTGLVKLVWGVLLGVLAAPGTGWGGLRGGLVIAATANLGNLFDRAPGRTIKVSLVGGALVLALGVPAGEVTSMALVLGAGAGDAAARPARALHARRHRLERARWRGGVRAGGGVRADGGVDRAGRAGGAEPRERADQLHPRDRRDTALAVARPARRAPRATFGHALIVRHPRGRRGCRDMLLSRCQCT